MGNNHSRRVGASYYAADGWSRGPVTWGASPAHAYADAIVRRHVLTSLVLSLAPR